MPKCLQLIVVLLALFGATHASAQIGGCTPDFSDPEWVLVETSVGPIMLELYPNMAPITVANFMDYVNGGDFDGAIFHRSVPGFVIQGGGFRENAGAYESIPTNPAIQNEPCLSNTAGTIAMARLGGQPNSATNQWFVNLVDNPFLDTTDGVGFTSFGRVVFGGMDTANAIAALPIEDTLPILENPFNQIFRALPLQIAPSDPPGGGYGCAQASPFYGLADETIDAVILDPLRRNAPPVVPILLDPACDGSGATGPPSVPCTTGRDVFAVNLTTQNFFSPRIAMSCSAVAEAEESWAARRAGTMAHYLAQDVEMVSVPEPSGTLPLVLAFASLTTLGRRRR